MIEAADLFSSVRNKITQSLHNSRSMVSNAISQLEQIRAYACINLIEHFERTAQPDEIRDCLIEIEKADPEHPALKHFRNVKQEES